MFWLGIFFVFIVLTIYFYKNPGESLSEKLGIKKEKAGSYFRNYNNIKIGFLSNLNFIVKLSELAREKGVFISPGHLGAVALFMSVAGFVVGNILFQSILFGIIVGVIGFYGGTRIYVEATALRERKKIDKQADIFLQSLISSLRGGKTLTGALKLAGQDTPSPLGNIALDAYYEIAYGNEDFEKALRNMVSKSGNHDTIDNIATVIIITRQTGGNIIKNLDNLRDILGDEAYAEELIKSKASNSISTALILNIVGLVLVFSINRAYPDALNQLFFESYLGRIILLVFLGMVATGWLIIFKLVNTSGQES